MPARHVRFRTLLATLTAFALVAACGDDDPSGPGGQASGPIGELAGVLDDATQELLVTNAGTFLSLDHFAPLIGGSLASLPPVSGLSGRGAALQTPCFPASALGTTFDYDFTQGTYVATGATGAPAGGVRFVLYPLDSSGNPQQGSPLGHVDLICDATVAGTDAYNLTVTLEVEVNGVTVLTEGMSGLINVGQGSASLNGTGVLTSADGGRSLSFEGGSSRALGATESGGGFTFDLVPADQLFASFGRLNQQGVFGVSVVVQKGLSQDLFEWAFELFAEGDVSGNITGPLRLSDIDEGTGVFACFSGSFAAPDVSPSADCANGEYQIPNVTDSHRQAARQAYQALHGLWAALIGVTDGGIDIAVSALGG